MSIIGRILDPRKVREFKTQFEVGLSNAFVAESDNLINSVMGTVWGKTLNAIENRELVNFLGEIYGRTASPEVKKIASQYYVGNKVNNGPMFNGSLTNNDRKEYNPPSIYNNRLPDNQNRQHSGRFNKEYTQEIWQWAKREHVQDTLKNMKNSNSPEHVIVGYLRGKGFTGNTDKIFKDFSENYLSSAIEEISTRSFDFNVIDVVKRISGNIINAMPKFGKAKMEYNKNLLAAYYSYLEDNGYKAYDIVLDTLNRSIDKNSTAEDFSENNDYINTLNQFKISANMYSKLSNENKEKIWSQLIENCGAEPTGEYIYNVDKYNEVGVPPTKKRLWFFKVTAVIVAAIALITKLVKVADESQQERLSKES